MSHVPPGPAHPHPVSHPPGRRGQRPAPTSRPDSRRLLRLAAWLALLALVLMSWAVLVPRPLPIMAWMSVGQLLGTVALGLLGYAVIRDLLAARLLARSSTPEPREGP